MLSLMRLMVVSWALKTSLELEWRVNTENGSFLMSLQVHLPPLSQVHLLREAKLTVI